MFRNRLIYRIETLDGIGPYQDHPNININDCPSYWRAPQPYDIKSVYYNKDYRMKYQIHDFYYAFPNLPALNRWFNKKRRRIFAQSGFVCSVYKIRECYVIADKYQCIFLKKKATKVDQYNLISLDSLAIPALG